MTALRNPQGGCPWDLKQTHQSLTPYLVEESHECIEAIEAGDDARMCEELGDLLLQIVFHAQLARERSVFDIDAVCEGIVNKMIRRHPHVFGDERGLTNAEEVLGRWEEIKKEEKGGARSALDGISSGLPALAQAALLQDRARRTGFAYRDESGAWTKLEEELQEFRQQPSPEEMGDALFALVSVARQHGIDPDAALRQANRKFRDRFQKVEECYPQGFEGLSSEQLVQAWNEAKEGAATPQP